MKRWQQPQITNLAIEETETELCCCNSNTEVSAISTYGIGHHGRPHHHNPSHGCPPHPVYPPQKES